MSVIYKFNDAICSNFAIIHLTVALCSIQIQIDCEENEGNQGVQEQKSVDASCELMDGNTDDTSS